mmetsp:Transcript_45475/g.71132  ORF Transcript_45475/g.71132 Transcript_45475/m.71132 type:complete len:315 (+) Transcript_45475:91-1035(+)
MSQRQNYPQTPRTKKAAERDKDCLDVCGEKCSPNDPYFKFNCLLPFVQLLFLLAIGGDILLNLCISTSLYTSENTTNFGKIGLIIAFLQMKLNAVYFLAQNGPLNVEAAPQLLHPGWSAICWIPFGFPLLILVVYPKQFMNACICEALSYVFFPFVYLALLFDHIHLWARDMHLREDLKGATNVLIVKIVATWYEAVPQAALQAICFLFHGSPSFPFLLASLCTGGTVLFFFMVTVYQDFLTWADARYKEFTEPGDLELGQSPGSARPSETPPLDAVQKYRRESLSVQIDQNTTPRGIKTTKYKELALRNKANL